MYNSDSEIPEMILMNKFKHLDSEEKEIVESYDNNEWQSAKNFDKERQIHAQYARNTSIKNKRINIRITERNFLSLKEKSQIEGIPYQSLISSILHKYINGTLKEKA
jgi:predicted DNA binding CopG/RHH family protein